MVVSPSQGFNFHHRASVNFLNLETGSWRKDWNHEWVLSSVGGRMYLDIFEVVLEELK